MSTLASPARVAACPLCCGRSHSAYRRVGKSELLSCRGCGLVFIPAGAGGDKAQYEQDETSPSGYYEATALLDRLTFDDRLGRLEQYVPLGRILDVGCNVGTFLKVAEARGWKGIGVEPNRAACAIAEQSGLTVVGGFFDETRPELLQGDFDAIHMGDVIEHVFDPIGFLRLAYQALRPGGVVGLVTPNFDSLLARLFQIKPREHVVYFTPGTLVRALESAGFQRLSLEVATRRRNLARLDRGTSVGGAGKLVVRVLRLTHTAGLASRLLYSVAHDELLAFGRKP